MGRGIATWRAFADLLFTMTVAARSAPTSARLSVLAPTPKPQTTTPAPALMLICRYFNVTRGPHTRRQMVCLPLVPTPTSHDVKHRAALLAGNSCGFEARSAPY
jgi:hypothetical protein